MAQHQPRAIRVPMPPKNDAGTVGHFDFADSERIRHLPSVAGIVGCHQRITDGTYISSNTIFE